MDIKAHWERVYQAKPDRDLSWFESDPARSVELVLSAPRGHGRVIDVGGGSSALVDRLLEYPFNRLAVLDISEAALNRARVRLRERARRVEWIAADITAIESVGEFDVWHDRAVFHFLTETSDREKYVALSRRTLPTGGHLILATFSINGPSRCSGLEVRRYDSPSLAATLGDGFTLTRELNQTHLTPSGKPQEFLYAIFRRTS